MPYSLPLSRFKKIRAWFSMIFLDDGYVRLFYRNFFKVNDNLYRANHPMPWDVASYKKRGINSIINLRGDKNNMPATALERVACQQQDIPLHFISLSSRSAPSVETIDKIIHSLEQAEKPTLVHCKSGADRAGLVVTLYNLHFFPDMSIEDANQLRWYYGHFTLADTGVLDTFITHWKRYKDQHPEATFLQWVHTDYDRQAVRDEFKSHPLYRWFVKYILRRE